MQSNPMLITLITVAFVAVVSSLAIVDRRGGKEVGDEDIRIREGHRLRGVGGELSRVGDVEGVLLDGQAQAKSRNGEEQVEAHHHDSASEDL